jgi:hypothetical protein
MAPSMILGIDYLFDNSLDTTYSTNPIKILTGDFKDVTFRYLTIGITEDDDEQGAVVNFSYEVVVTNGKKITRTEFDPVAEKILENILTTSLEENDNREEDIIESDPE